MSTTENSLSALRSRCRGLVPLDARLEAWMAELMQQHSADIFEQIDRHGSPLNIVSTAPFVRNIEALNAAARAEQLPFRVYFARKANKCLGFVEAALQTGAGVDVASLEECQQALAAGARGNDLICTAAIKTQELINLCIADGVTVAIDNFCELERINAAANEAGRTVNCALRFGGFQHAGARLETRFGFDVSEASRLLEWFSSQKHTQLTVQGLHFHLDGYSAPQRVSAIEQSLQLIDEFRQQGHHVRFLDIGGGFPVSYLQSQEHWTQFWDKQRAALLREIEPLTYRNHGLGLMVVNGEIVGQPQLYPYWQSPVGATWFSSILNSTTGGGETIAEAIRQRSLELRCEPGRNLLDGCGVTVARVEYTKRHISGHGFVGLAMNRTQCRTSSDDFLVDPLLIPADASASACESARFAEGFLTGAYCTEAELLLLRKLRFPQGVKTGDLIVFPNTAGYLMHFLESRSHQFPLAKNLTFHNDSETPFQLDRIDA